MKQLDITQLKARKLVKQICEDLDLETCAVYFNDLTFLGETLGIYEKESEDLYAYMLIETRWSRRLVIVLHEVTHHLQNENYHDQGSTHGYGFQLAKGRIATWARDNISDHFDWFSLLTAKTDGRYRCKKKKKKK